MSSLSRIFGWTPSRSEELVIPPRPIPPRSSSLRIFTTQSLHHKSVGRDQSSPANFEVALPPSPSTSSLSPDSALRSEPEPLGRDDPDWVARPRNPFIIFRCEYSREHAKEGKRVRRPPGSQAEKTLSKRAAEAWHQLSAEEKNRFKKLADEEREAHARLHPNYRFKPVKRTTAKKRPVNTLKLQSQPSKLPTTSETIIAPIPRYPPLNDAQDTSAALEPNDSPPLNMAAMVKVTRRRSASAPSLPLTQPPFKGSFNPGSPRLKVKRSRSLMANRTSPIQTDQASSYEDLSFDPGLFDLADFAREFDIGDSLSSEIGSVELPFNDQFSNYGTPGLLSPLSGVASSIASWQGEQDIMGNQLSPLCSPWSSSPAVGIEAEPLHQYTEYQSTDAGLAMAAETYTSTNDPWTTSSYFPAVINMTNATEGTGTLYAPMISYDEAERAYALQEYGLGLNMHVGEALSTGEEHPELAMPNSASYF